MEQQSLDFAFSEERGRSTTEADHMAVFEAWSQVRLQGPKAPTGKSIDVDRRRWRAVAKWLCNACLTLHDATALDLQRMLAQVQGTAAYRKRLLALVARVAAHNAPRDYCHPAKVLLNRPEFRRVDTKDTTPLPTTLSPFQEDALRQALTKRVREGSWKRQRDAALLAACLGAGTKPGKVRVLCVDAVMYDGPSTVRPPAAENKPWKLRLPADGNSATHDSVMVDWAAAVMRDWLETRARLFSASCHCLFPAELGRDEPVAENTLNKQLAQLLDELGLELPRGGMHVLRHTFAVRNIQRGKAPRDVQRYLGLKTQSAVERYTRVIHGRA